MAKLKPRLVHAGRFLSHGADVVGEKSKPHILKDFHVYFWDPFTVAPCRIRQAPGDPSDQKHILRGFGECLSKLSPMLAHGGNAASLLSHGADVVGKKIKNYKTQNFNAFSWTLGITGSPCVGKRTESERPKTRFKRLWGCLLKLSPVLAHGSNAGSLLSHGTDVAEKNIKTIISGFSHRGRRSRLRRSARMTPCRLVDQTLKIVVNSSSYAPLPFRLAIFKNLVLQNGVS